MGLKTVSKPVLGLVCVLASACTQQQAAEISFRGDRFYGFGGGAQVEQPLMASTSMQAAAPVMEVSSSEVSAPAGLSSNDLPPPVAVKEEREEQQQAAAPVAQQPQPVQVAEAPIAEPSELPARLPTAAKPAAEPQTLTVAEARPMPQGKVATGQMHTLQPGETLYRVSRTYAVSLDELIAVNGISDVNAVKVGTQLRLPADSLEVAEPVMQAKAPDIVPVTTATKPVKPIELASADLKQVTLPKATASNKPFIWPVEGKVISQFGPKSGGLYNDGVNISAPLGTPVRAVAPGEVVYAGNELKGYGNLVILKHADGHLSAYAHMQHIEVEKGQKLLQGDAVGQVGQSGHVDKPQLHFGLRKGKAPVDPMTVLKDAPKTRELAAL